MDPVTVITLAISAAKVVKDLAPEIRRLFEAGEITAQQQQELLAEINAIRTHAAFTGPEWELSGR